MGKKVKKKARSGQKDKRVSSVSPKTVPHQESNNAEAPVNVIGVVKSRGLCSHVDRGINLEKLSAKLRSSESLKCEDCRGNAADRRPKKGQGKHGKKGGTNSKSESKSIWVCLECGHYSCGGVGFPTIPQSHAVRHSKQNHHPLVVHYENHQLLWCFLCDKLVPVENSEDNKHKEVLNEVVKLLKGPGERPTVDVEDLWFGGGSVTSAIKSDYSVSTGTVDKAGYSIRGLSNLGNTCFFNSVMQNLLAINILREYFFKLDESVGPLSASTRKLFLETHEAGSKGVISPRSLFGSLCTKAPQFRGYQQHDSHEFLRCLLDGLSTEELSVRKHAESSQSSITDPTFVDAIFGGQLSSTVSCLECGHSSTIYEPFLDLSLPVPTKKPPSRRTQASTRCKKQKLPPKRNGKILSKVSREANALPRERAIEQSTGGSSSSEVHSMAEPTDHSVLSLGDPAPSASTNPSSVALDMGLTAGDLSAIQNPENQPAVQHVGDQSVSEDSLAWLDYLAVKHVGDLSISEDSFTWLDYLEPNSVPHVADRASETDDISAVQDFANEDGQQHGVSLSVASDSRIGRDAVNGVSVDDARDIDDPEPRVIAKEQSAFSRSEDGQNVKPQFSERLPPDGSSTEEVVPTDVNRGHSSESCSQFCNKDLNTSGTDNKSFSQKEAASSSVEVPRADVEVSSSVVGEEQDSLGFDGLGDLFNEPEVFEGPSDQPFSQAVNIPKNGVLGNTSESDPDEVDSANAPVSVESCLALFTRPEFLSKDEHAWQCDNCTKILREQRIETRKLQMPISGIVPNGCEDRNSSGMLDVGNTCRMVKSINGNPEVDLSKAKSVTQNRVICENGKCILGSQSETGTDVSHSQSENPEIPTTNSCHGPSENPTFTSQTCDPACGQVDSEIDGSVEIDLPSAKCEQEETEQEEVSSENVKAKRDANKSILISKIPSILTIHLKRFSQDARGRLSKLNGHVNFGETIDLKPYVDPRCTEKDTFTYHLVGLVEHLGTMRGGHYVAYLRGGKDEGDGVWYHASDAYVRRASLEEVLRCEAYILFYERT